MMQIHPIDLKFQDTAGVIAAFLVDSGGELALVETGPGSTLDTLCKGIEELGFSPDEVRKVLVTHIHLDHAGAAGWWAGQGATVYVHRRGARHLIDPSVLMDSVEMVYGDQTDELWGEMLPAAEDRVVALEDGDEVRVGDSVITAIDTPGHARHHHAFVCDGGVFAGDVAGARLPGQKYISVTSAPPQFDAEAYDKSISRLLQGDYAKLFLTHFGVVDDVREHLERYRVAVRAAAAFVAERLVEGMDGESLRIAYQAYQMEQAFQAGTPPEVWAAYETANPTGMCADGLRIGLQS